MKKTFTCLTILISMFFMQNNVFAAYTEGVGYEIDSIEEAKEEFAGKATIEGNKITLTSDIEFLNPDCNDTCEEFEKYSVVNIKGNYEIDLNGQTIKANELYFSNGNIVIKDSKNTGKIDTDFLLVELHAEVTINNGTFNFIANEGNLIVKNGDITGLQNAGNLIIKDGNFRFLAQFGTATIEGGTFTSYQKNEYEQYYTAIDLENTILKGGEFITSNMDYALQIQSKYELDENSINKAIPKGFVAIHEGYKFLSNEDANVSSYTSLKIVEDDCFEMMEKIAPNGVWKVNSYKPLEPSEGQTLLTALMIDSVDKKIVKNVQAWYDTNPEEATVILFLNDNSVREYTLKVNYNTPDITSNKEVSNILSNLKKLDRKDLDEETSYRVEDLYLINYLYSNPKGMDVSLALNFSEELIKASNGSNVHYRIIGQFGGGNPNGLYTYFADKAVVYFNNVAYKTIYAGVNLNHLLYIPSNTKNTTDAYIDAAMERIKDYLGTTEGIKIEVGGTLESLNYYDNYAGKEITWNEYGFIDEKTSGVYYYNITINGKTHKFAICKKDNLEKPKYLTSDILSNIVIKSDSSKLPLDTAISVEIISNDTIKKALGTENYKAYDISLYSNAKEEKITRLEDSKFEVSIPIPKELESKNISVYYVNDKGEKVEHSAKVKDNYVVFETDHFSTYALVENTNLINNVEVPKTADGIISYLILTIISVFGIVLITRQLRKKSN